MYSTISRHFLDRVRPRLRRRRRDGGRDRDAVPAIDAACIDAACIDAACIDAADIDVAYVDDPFEPVRLVRARGHVGPISIERLFEAFADLRPPHHVHLDVGDARIDDPATMDRLAAALDRLERLQIDVRIVGIDPQHPALRA